MSIFQVDGDEGADEMPETELKNAAWYYPEPMEKAKKIKDYVAFCEFSSFLFFLFSNFSLVCVFREGVEGIFFISEALQLDGERYLGSRTDCVDRD